MYSVEENGNRITWRKTWGLKKFPLHHQVCNVPENFDCLFVAWRKKVTLALKQILTNKVKWSEIMIGYLEICLAHVCESTMPGAGLIQRSQGGWAILNHLEQNLYTCTACRTWKQYATYRSRTWYDALILMVSTYSHQKNKCQWNPAFTPKNCNMFVLQFLFQHRMCMILTVWNVRLL